MIYSYFIFALLISRSTAQVNKELNVVFNPLPIIEMNTKEYGKYLSTTTIIEDFPNILVAVFLKQNLLLLDLNENCKIISQYKHTILSAQSRGSFLFFVTDDQQMIIQQFLPQTSKDNLLHQYLINVNIYSNKGLEFNSLYIDDQQKYAYLGCFGQLVILDISNKINIQEIAIRGVKHDFTYCVTVIENQYVLLSNYYSNIIVFDISNIKNPTFYRTLSFYGKESIQSYFFKDQQLLYSISYFYCLQITNLQMMFKEKTKFQTIVEQDYTSDTFNLVLINVINSMAVSSDEKYFFMGVRSNGLLIYDISTPENKKSPVLIQNIDSFGFSAWIQTTGINDRYIVFSEGLSLKIYEKTLPNTSQAIINTFNLDQCTYVNSFENEQWPWSSLLIENRYLVVAGGFKGFKIFDMKIPLLPEETFKDKRQEKSYDGCYYLKKKKILLIGQSEKGIAFYDASKNFAQPTFLFEKIFTENPDTDDFMSNENEDTLAFIDEKYFGFVNITDINNMVLIDTFKLPPSESRSIEAISMDSNFQYGCSAVRNRGIYYFKYDYPQGEDPKTSQKKIQIIEFVQLLGAESVRYDKRDNGIFYVADGVSGVTVLNSSDKSKSIQFVSSTPVSGWVGRVFQPDGNLDILIVSHHDRGSISVMDISNWKQVQKIQELEFIQFGSFSSVTDKSNTFLAITVPNGIRVCQTDTPLILHTQMKANDNLDSASKINIYEKFDESNNQKQNIVAEIGQSVSFSLTPLYYSKGFQVIQLLFYDEFQLKQIPNWITLSPYSQMINLLPQKQLNSDIKNFYVLLVQLSLQIYPEDFIQSSYNLSETESNNIYNYLINIGILNKDGYLRSNYDPSVRFVVNWSNIFTNNNIPSDDLLIIIYNFIKYKLVRSKFFFPVSFKVKPSLLIDLNSSTGMVLTLSSQAGVYLSIIYNSDDFVHYSSKPQFIHQQYNGVLSDLKNSNQNLELKGIVASVNNILKNQIYLFSPNSTYHLIQIRFQVTDDLNTDIEQTFNLSQITQFNLKKSIKNKLIIQQQYDQQYPDGLTVETSFTINIDASTFEAEPFLKITYEASIKDNGNWRNLTSEDWIQLDATGSPIILRGMANLAYLSKSFQIKIIASDNYEIIDQEFILEFTKIPLRIIFQYIGYILIILFFIILIYCLRQKLHQKFLKSFFVHSLEKTYYKDYYYRKVYLMQNMHSISTKLLHLMKTEFIQNNKQNLLQVASIGVQSNMNDNEQQIDYSELLFLQQYLNAEGVPNMTQVMQDAYKVSTNHPSQFKSLPSSEFNHTNTRLYTALNSLFVIRILATDRKTEEIFQTLKRLMKKRTQKVLDWYQPLLEVQYGCEPLSSEKQGGQAVGTVDQIQFPLTHSKIKEEKLFQSNFTTLNDKNVYQGQPSQFAVGKSNGATALTSSIGEPQDGIFTLPEAKINEDSLLAEIKTIYNQYERQQTKLIRQNSSDFTYNIHLLKSAIRAECLGFSKLYKPSNYKSSNGSVLHLCQGQIKNIFLFQKSDEIVEQKKSNFSKNCSGVIRQFFGLNYTKIAQNFQSSSSVRSWLRFEVTENYILLQGMPSKLNIGDYMIQIENSNRYVSYQYSLQVGKQKSDSRLQSIKQKLNKIKENNKQQGNVLQIPHKNSYLQIPNQSQISNDPLSAIEDKSQLNDPLKQNDALKHSKFNSFDQQLTQVEGINISSVLNLKPFNKPLKIEDDVESYASINDLPQRMSVDKSFVNQDF